MIDKRDLRIGNMFEQGIVWKISGRAGAKVHLHGKGKWYKGFRQDVSVEDLKPVPLTPTVLVDWCGFRNMGGDIYCGEKFALIFNGEFFILSLAEPIELRCLHELQNLIYVFTKKELEIKG